MPASSKGTEKPHLRAKHLYICVLFFFSFWLVNIIPFKGQGLQVSRYPSAIIFAMIFSYSNPRAGFQLEKDHMVTKWSPEHAKK